MIRTSQIADSTRDVMVSAVSAPRPSRSESSHPDHGQSGTHTSNLGEICVLRDDGKPVLDRGCRNKSVGRQDPWASLWTTAVHASVTGCRAGWPTPAL